MASSDKVRILVEQIALVNPYTNAKDLPHVPRPKESSIPQHLTPLQRIPHVQRLINELKYNFLPRTFFSLEKRRSLQSILQTSRDILSEALPIRCLEATFLGLYLTQSLKGVDRIPLSFKSRINGRTYHHIVLVIRCNSLYGAIGLSRKPGLMDKQMAYRSLYDLVMEYKHQYEAIGHRLVDCKLGLCASHNVHYQKAPCWRYIVVRLDKNPAAHTPRTPRDADVSSGADMFAASPLSADVEPSTRSDVSTVLGHFAHLVCVISDQYDRYAAPSHAVGAQRQAHPLPLRDLDELDDDDARAENRRRLSEIREGRSPCTLPAMTPKKRAASRSVSTPRGAGLRQEPRGLCPAAQQQLPPLPPTARAPESRAETPPVGAGAALPPILSASSSELMAESSRTAWELMKSPVDQLDVFDTFASLCGPAQVSGEIERI